MSLIDLAMFRSRTVLAVLGLVLVAGLSAYIDIAKEASPDVAIPNVYVSMTLKGISPGDSDRLLIRPMESELRSVEGIKEIRSDAFHGGGYVLLEFEAGFDADKAVADVREKVDSAKADLPDEAEEPRVIEINLSLLPVLVVTLGGEIPERALLRLARDLKDRIEGIPSVLEAAVGGDRKEQVEIIVDPLLLDSYAIDPAEVLNIVSRSNRLIAAGSLDSERGSFAMKVPGLFESVQDIWGIPLKVSGDSVVTVGDIASLRRTFEDRRSYARLNGRPAISLEIKKRTGENIIDTVRAVRALVERESAHWPPGVEVTFSSDQSRFIQTMLSDLQNNVVAAVLLVMIIVAGALGLRTGLLVGVAIPGSFLAGILVLSASGLTVNMVVLFSLILSVGLLVDGAIVVTEYADRKMVETASRADRDSRRQAYAEAARRMSWPIIASTATTLAAFLPLLFWPGMVGEFMRYLPITLIAVLSASLLMALVFVPTLGAQIGRPGTSSVRAIEQMVVMEEGSIHDVKGGTGLYVRALEFVLRHPAKVALLAVATLVAAWALYASYGKGFEFFPKIEPDRAFLKIFARGNMSVHSKARLVGQVERQILDVQEERGEIESIYILSGTMPAHVDTTGDLIGTISLEFADWETRRGADDILADIVARAERFAGIRVETAKEEAGPPVGKPIHLLVSSRDPDLLAPAVARIVAHLERMSGLKDLEDERPPPGIEWELRVDRAQAAKFGADTVVIGNIIRLATNGFKVADYRPDDADDEVEIVVRYPGDHRTLDQIDDIRVQTSRGLVPLSNFLTREPRPRTGKLKRTDGFRSMAVKGRRASGRARQRQGARDPGLDRRPAVLRSGREHRVQGGGQGTEGGRPVPAAGVRVRAVPDDDHPGGAVQQVLLGVSHPVGRRHVHRGRDAGASGDRAAFQHRHERDRGDRPRRHRRQQQHRADRHVRPAVEDGVERHRGDPAHGRAASAAGAPDHGHHHSRADADGDRGQHRLRRAPRRDRRALHADVAAARHGDRLRPRLRHHADAVRDPGAAHGPRQRRGLEGPAPESGAGEAGRRPVGRRRLTRTALPDPFRGGAVLRPVRKRSVRPTVVSPPRNVAGSVFGRSGIRVRARGKPPARGFRRLPPRDRGLSRGQGDSRDSGRSSGSPDRRPIAGRLSSVPPRSRGPTRGSPRRRTATARRARRPGPTTRPRPFPSRRSTVRSARWPP